MPEYNEEWANAQRARARARRAEAERVAAGNNKKTDPGVRAALMASSARTRGEAAESDVPEIKRSVGEEKLGIDPTGDVTRVLADRFTRGGSDRLLAAMSGRTVEEERAVTEATQAKNPISGAIAGAVGDVAPLAALPGAAVAGPVRAAVTGGAVGGADVAANSLAREGELPTMADAGVGIAFGAGGGVLGHYVGKAFADRYIKQVGLNKPLHRQTQASLQKTIDEQNLAAQTMRDAGVRLNRSSVRGLAKKIERGILNTREFNLAYRMKDVTPKAKEALGRLKEITDLEDKPLFDDLNEYRKIIRESTRNDRGEVIAGYRDNKIIEYIDDTVRDYLEGIGANKVAVASGDVNKALSGFREMNRLTGDKYKQTVVSAVLERAHFTETAGTSYDKALQQQFRQLVQPSIRGQRNPALKNFSAEEIKLLEEAAEGGLTTKVLNRMDNSFGHGLLSDLHRTYAIATRKAVKPSAVREAGKVFEGVGGKLPAQPKEATGLGVRAGIAAGGGATDRITETEQ